MSVHVRLEIRIPKSLHDSLRAEAYNKDVSMTKLTTWYIEMGKEYVARLQKGTVRR